MLRRIMTLVSQLIAYLEKKMGFSWKCPDLGPGNWHYDAFILESGYAVSHWHERTADHHSSVIENIKDEGHAAAERIIQLHSLLGNLINFGLVAVGAVAVLSQSILKTQPLMLVIPFTLLAICIAIAAYALRPPHVELKSGDELEVLNQNISAASQREGGWKLAHEISERKTVIIRQNVLEWIAGIVRVPICLFILAIISIPVVAMYGKADHTSETDEPKSLTVVVEDEPLKMQVMELKDSLGKLTDSVKETGTAASDERKSVVAAVNELRAKIDQRLTTVEKAVSMLSESLKQEKDIDPKQQ